MLDVLRSLKQGHILSSLLTTTAAAYDLDFLQKAKSVNELTGLKDEDKAILLKHGDKKSLSSLVSQKLGQNNNNLTSLLNTTAAAYDLDFLQKAKSVNDLTGLKDEDKAILLKHGDKKSLSSLISRKHGQKDHKTVRSKLAITMNHNRETKRQKMLETLGSKRLFCGFCGATKYFEEGSRVRGTCLESCYSRDCGFSGHKHSEWKAKNPSQKEMNALIEDNCARKQSYKDPSEWAITMTHNRETKRQKMLETLGSNRLFCGFCGETKFFKEGSRVRGTCLESCYSRDCGFSEHRHSEWKAKNPSQKEMNALIEEYCARKQS
eukprot:scaffold729_cov201-Alexandrium_tamarense.AAC.1